MNIVDQRARRGQSMFEVLVALGIGTLLFLGAITAIAPSLRGNAWASQAETETQLAGGLLSNAKSWAEGNWNSVLALATSSANTYWLSTTSSPYIAVAGTQTISVGVASSTVSSTQYFYLGDVYRDANGNVTTTVAGNSYDPSTKQITAFAKIAGTRTPTTTLVAYLTRNIANIFGQTNWSGGPGQNGPITTTNSQFATSTGIIYSSGALLATAAASSSPSYLYYRSITVTSTISVASGTNSHFPMLVSSTLSSWENTGRGGKIQNFCTAPNGRQEPCDLVFATSSANCNATPLSFETESYASSTGALVAWVNVPTLAAGTVIYACYGNASTTTDQSHPSSTWNSNYVAVWHMQDAAAPVKDSTKNGNNLTVSTGTPLFLQSGEIGYSIQTTSTSYLAINSLNYGTTAKGTWEMWVLLSSSMQSGNNMFTSDQSEGTPRMYYYNNCYVPGCGPGFMAFYGDPSYNYNSKVLPVSNYSGIWYFLAFSNDTTQSTAASQLTFYVDGSSSGTTTGPYGATTTGNISTSADFRVGQGSPSGAEENAEEIRVSSVAVSPSWILTEYNNQSNPSTFYAVGSETALSSASVNTLDASTFDTGDALGAQFNSIAWQGTQLTGSTVQFQFAASNASSGPWNFMGTDGTANTYYTPTGPVSPVSLNYAAFSGSRYFRYRVAITSATSSASFSNGYTYSRAITASTTLVAPSGTALSSFPMLISGTYSYLAASSSGGNVQNPNGYDIIFTSDASGTITLPFERESYASSTGAINYWVKVPTLSSSSNVIYMFYDNSSIATAQSNATGTWNSNYQGVWHFANNPTLNINDSTGLVSSVNNGATTSTGQIDGAAGLNGSTQYIDAPMTVNYSGITVEAWFDSSNLSGGGYNPRIVANSHTDTDTKGFQLMFNDGGGSGFFDVGNGTTNISSLWTQTLSNNTWYHYVGTYDGTNARVYINGALVGTSANSSGALSASGVDVNIGRNGAYSSDYFTGTVDEVRISNVAYSADWIKTEYNNQLNPSAFYTIGSATTAGSGNSSSQVNGVIVNWSP